MKGAVLSETGVLQPRDIDQDTIHVLFNYQAYGFVGAIYDCNAFALAYEETEGMVANVVAAQFPQFFETSVRGPIVFVGSDENGDACDIDVSVLSEFLNIKSFDY